MGLEQKQNEEKLGLRSRIGNHSKEELGLSIAKRGGETGREGQDRKEKQIEEEWGLN